MVGFDSVAVRLFRVEMYQFKNVVNVNRADLNVGKRFSKFI